MQLRKIWGLWEYVAQNRLCGLWGICGEGECVAQVPRANPIPCSWLTLYCDREIFPTESGLNFQILLNTVPQVRATAHLFTYYTWDYQV